METNPLVSIVLPNYKTDRHLETAVQSILNQSYENFEIILIDSSGTELVEDIADKDDRIKYRYQDPVGLAAARNEGLDAVGGEFVSFQDADDSWRTDKLERQLLVFDTDGVDFVYSDEYISDGEERHYHSTLPVKNPDRHYIEFFRRGSGIPVRTVMARRECFEHHRFNEELPAREDSNLWVRILQDAQPARISEPLATKVMRGDAMTADVDLMYRSELNSIEDLVNRIPRLKRYEAERLSQTHYKYGKQLLVAGRTSEARDAALKSLGSDARNGRAYMLLVTSSLPLTASRRIGLWNAIEKGWNMLDQR